MKNKSKVIIFFVLLFALITAGSPLLEWGRVYNRDGVQEMFHITAGFNGIYIVGSTSPSEINESILVMKLDDRGNVIYERVLNESRSDWALWGFENFDDDFTVIGSSRKDIFYDFYIAKLGENEFRKHLQNFGIDKATSGIEFVDGYYIIGHSTDFDTLNMRGRMIKIDKNTHEVVLDTWLPHFKAGVDVKPLSIELTTDGNFVIAGTAVNYFQGNTNFFVSKVTTQGEEIWTNVLTNKPYSRGFDIVETNGGYLAVGYATSWERGWSDVYLIKLSESGDILWDKVLDYAPSASDRGYSVKVHPNGNIYVAGYVTRHGNTQIALFEFDSTGYQLSETLLGGEGIDIAYSLDICIDGYIYITGFTTSGDYGVQKQDAIVLKYSVQ